MRNKFKQVRLLRLSHLFSPSSHDAVAGEFSGSAQSSTRLQIENPRTDVRSETNELMIASTSGSFAIEKILVPIGNF